MTTQIGFEQLRVSCVAWVPAAIEKLDIEWGMAKHVASDVSAKRIERAVGCIQFLVMPVQEIVGPAKSMQDVLDIGGVRDAFAVALGKTLRQRHDPARFDETHFIGARLGPILRLKGPSLAAHVAQRADIGASRPLAIQVVACNAGGKQQAAIHRIV